MKNNLLGNLLVRLFPTFFVLHLTLQPTYRTTLLSFFITSLPGGSSSYTDSQGYVPSVLLITRVSFD